MKKLLAVVLLFPLIVHAEIIIELDQVFQSASQCDSIIVNYTATAHEGNVTIIPQLKDGFGNVISSDTVVFVGSIDNFHGIIKIAVPSGTTGLHTCVLTAYDNLSQTAVSNTENIELNSCSTGIIENNTVPCSVQLSFGGLIVSLIENREAVIQIIDVSGKTILNTVVNGVQYLPIHCLSGIYIVNVQQSGFRMKTFKFFLQ